MRYKKHIRAEIEKHIHDAIIGNLSHKETIQYVFTVMVKQQTLSSIKEHIKHLNY